MILTKRGFVLRIKIETEIRNEYLGFRKYWKLTDAPEKCHVKNTRKSERKNRFRRSKNSAGGTMFAMLHSAHTSFINENVSQEPVFVYRLYSFVFGNNFHTYMYCAADSVASHN